MPDVEDRSQATIGQIRRTPGAWLYHYTTLETALVYVLSTLKLRLGPFSDMRDPREYKRWWMSAVGYGDDMEAFSKQYGEAEERVNALRQQFKLVAFTTDAADSESEYDRGFARSRLWGEYAGGGDRSLPSARPSDRN